MKRRLHFAGLVLVLCSIAASAVAAALPRPLPEHPGNIFVAGEHVVVPVDGGGEWTVTDYEGKTTPAVVRDGKADLGELGGGYYELRQPGKPKITVGVIAP